MSDFRKALHEGYFNEEEEEEFPYEQQLNKNSMLIRKLDFSLYPYWSTRRRQQQQQQQQHQQYEQWVHESVEDGDYDEEHEEEYEGESDEVAESQQRYGECDGEGNGKSPL